MTIRKRHFLVFLPLLLSSCFKTDVDPSSVLLASGKKGQSYNLSFTTVVGEEYIDLYGSKYPNATDSPLKMPFDGCVNSYFVTIDNSIAGTGSCFLFVADNLHAEIDIGSFNDVQSFHFMLHIPFFEGERIQFHYPTATAGVVVDAKINIGNCK